MTGMSDQQLEASYTNHFEPKITGIKNEIASLERTIQSTKDPVLKEQREGILEFYRDQLDAYEANSFNNVVGNYGREAAYNTLYDNQFRSNYLDPYSYTDRVTKIETYDNDVQQRTYEHKLERLAFDKDKEDFNQQVKIEELRLKQEEIDLKKTGDGTGKQNAAPGQPGYVAPLMGTEAVLEYDETLSKIEEHQKRNKDILNQTKTLFGITTDGEARGLSKIFNEGFAGKEFIEYNGKKINVAENLDLLLQFQNNVLNESPVEKVAMEQFNEAVDQSLTNLRKITQGDNPDWIAEESTPRFNFRFVKDKETGIMKRVEVKNSSP